MTTDLAIPDASAIEQASDPAQFVELACERAKEWLAQALVHGDIDGIVELKSQAEAIRTYTVQKQLGKDAELSAAEIVRRAERGIGLAIRRGQEAGEIAKRGVIGVGRGRDLTRPTDFGLSKDELNEGAYPLSEATAEHFEAGLTDAKDEGNLSRANVVRKVARRKILNTGRGGKKLPSWWKA